MTRIPVRTIIVIWRERDYLTTYIYAFDLYLKTKYSEMPLIAHNTFFTVAINENTYKKLKKPDLSKYRHLVFALMKGLSENDV